MRIAAISKIGWILFWGLSTASADEVVLKNGRHVEGTIVIETSGKVVLNQAGKNLVLARIDIESIVKSARIATQRAASDDVKNSTTAQAVSMESAPAFSFWPPIENQRYPDLVLHNELGQLVRLSSFQGKVILLETVAMTCEGCQGMSGARDCGAYANVPIPSSDLTPLEEYFPRFTDGLQLSDPRIVYVQLILYDVSMKAPSVEEIKAWAEHFKLTGRSNVYVLAAAAKMLGPASYDMIPGFHLIDKNFVLRYVFEGDGRKGNLGKLLPMIPGLITE